jgi:hypothetical protein
MDSIERAIRDELKDVEQRATHLKATLKIYSGSDSPRNIRKRVVDFDWLDENAPNVIEETFDGPFTIEELHTALNDPRSGSVTSVRRWLQDNAVRVNPGHRPHKYEPVAKVADRVLREPKPDPVKASKKPKTKKKRSKQLTQKQRITAITDYAHSVTVFKNADAQKALGWSKPKVTQAINEALNAHKLVFSHIAGGGKKGRAAKYYKYKPSTVIHAGRGVSTQGQGIGGVA